MVVGDGGRWSEGGGSGFNREELEHFHCTSCDTRAIDAVRGACPITAQRHRGDLAARRRSRPTARAPACGLYRNDERPGKFFETGAERYHHVPIGVRASGTTHDIRHLQAGYRRLAPAGLTGHRERAVQRRGRVWSWPLLSCYVLLRPPCEGNLHGAHDRDQDKDRQTLRRRR